MKIWLNDLKEGDEFYHIILNEVYKCKHLGDANNPNYRMKRIKYKILDNNNLVKILNETFGVEQEIFVNQYVYDNFDDAKKTLLESLHKKIEDIHIKKIKYTNELNRLEKDEEWLKKLIENYGKYNIKKDITES